jgi:hypothetical protein
MVLRDLGERFLYPIAKKILTVNNFFQFMTSTGCPVIREKPVTYKFLRYKKCFLLNQMVAGVKTNIAKSFSVSIKKKLPEVVFGIKGATLSVTITRKL